MGARARSAQAQDAVLLERDALADVRLKPTPKQVSRRSKAMNASWLAERKRADSAEPR